MNSTFKMSIASNAELKAQQLTKKQSNDLTNSTQTWQWNEPKTKEKQYNLHEKNTNKGRTEFDSLIHEKN